VQYWYFHAIQKSKPSFNRLQVPLNPAFNAAQIVAALTHLDASHLIISTETNLPRKEPRPNEKLLRHLIPGVESSKVESDLVPSLKEVVIVENSDGRVDTSSWRAARRFQDVLEDGESRKRLPVWPLHSDEVVNIQFTSGTTAMPKAACLTHASILNNGNSIGDRMLLTPEDIVCCPPPLFQ
jgi:TBC1 domain family member 8/9